MNDTTLFNERQYFRQWWILAILAGVNGLFIYGTLSQVIGGKAFGDKPMSDNGLMILTAIMFLVTLVMLYSRLDTVVKADGIYVRFFPFHLKLRHYQWDTLNSVALRDYAALLEYGGWGLKFSLTGKGTSFTISGKTGLQLVFNDGKKLLIGTRKPEELSLALTLAGKVK